MTQRIIVLAVWIAAWAAGAAAQDRVAVRVEGGNLYRLVEPDRILHMDEPSFVPKALAASFMGESEPVIGVARGKQAKAYSVWLLEGYSVINDLINNEPIVVSWSPFSYSYRVFDRVVDGDTLDFEDSGEMWNDVLVLTDTKTKSRWSQIKGEAIDGPMKGKKLKLLPSIKTSWGMWHLLYPHTYCLTKLGRDITKSDFLNYYGRNEQLGPVNSKNSDSRLVGKELICGFMVGDTPVAVPLYALVEHKQFPLVVNSKPLEVEFDDHTETTVVLSRELDGQTLDLVRLDFSGGESYLRLNDDSSMWLTYSGKGISGARSDKTLKIIPSTTCFWWAWVLHYPLTQLWEQPGTQPVK